MRAVIGWKSVLYESLCHAICQIVLFDLLRDFFLAFFDNWKWTFGTSEPASS